MPSSKKLVIYTLAQCSTCRDATKWLRAHGIDFAEKPIRETPPSETELRRMLAFQGGNVRKLLNSSGLEYRALGLSRTLPAMTEDEVLSLLASNGSLVKRPFALGGKAGAVGFDEEVWTAKFAGA